ncbi:hypothetical protein U9M48_016314 [Paspalum notatum var. saurae]|uniref:Replication factor A C-terminal domain-containing protein n=1 Tax=Paspalum notatum var. saurae TaxID=547442 RepID=A0AAQ3T621_PASNO
MDNGYKCTVLVSQIPDNSSWWYISCLMCKKKMAVELAGGYRCPKCQGTQSVPRYSFSFIGNDDTAEASFFAFDEAATSIIGKECKAVLNPLKMTVCLRNSRTLSPRNLRSRLFQLKTQAVPEQEDTSGSHYVHRCCRSIGTTPPPAPDADETPSKDPVTESSAPLGQARRPLFVEKGVPNDTRAQDHSPHRDSQQEHGSSAELSLHPRSKRHKTGSAKEKNTDPA